MNRRGFLARIFGAVVAVVAAPFVALPKAEAKPLRCESAHEGLRCTCLSDHTYCHTAIDDKGERIAWTDDGHRCGYMALRDGTFSDEWPSLLFPKKKLLVDAYEGFEGRQTTLIRNTSEVWKNHYGGV